MHWECARKCGARGSKRYTSADDASRYARGLEGDSVPAGEGRMPLVSALPLRLLRRIRGRAG
ncbi:MAG: hypothetical protein QOH00_3813 [Gaiellales bacterium]|jgi:hypothetical protein|nr:hypothetical protein [Gaiellales bacterium]